MIPRKVLIIQTAFLGDVILATGLIEKIKQTSPDTIVDFLLKKGNESILANNPQIRKVLVFDKKRRIGSMYRLIREIRKEKYDLVLNLHRFASSGILAMCSAGTQIAGFDKNPFSFLYSRSYMHEIGKPGVHEIDRNALLIEDWCGKERVMPRMYISGKEEKRIEPYQEQPYVCMAPGSVWFTKRFPQAKWVELLDNLSGDFNVYLLGAPGEKRLCEEIIEKTINPRVISLAGELSVTASAALMKDAVMNVVNDSAPLHIATAVNAPVCAVFCSTVPEFGFGPLSQESYVVETKNTLTCRPCNLHGKATCPLGHFDCAQTIEVERIRVIIENKYASSGKAEE